MHLFIDLSRRQYRTVWDHLLPDSACRENAAFIFAEYTKAEQSVALATKDYFLVDQSGFRVQRDDYIELTDECRIEIIKHAHQKKLALIELHSHPFNDPRASQFSWSDLKGFEETVPHMWWRLPNRPYAAVVASPYGFDSLVWHKNPYIPDYLTALRVDGEQLKPTCRSLGEKYVN